jgi:hypothetical protein
MCAKGRVLNEFVPKIKAADYIEKTPHLQRAYEFGKNIYGTCDGQ